MLNGSYDAWFGGAGIASRECWGTLFTLEIVRCTKIEGTDRKVDIRLHGKGNSKLSWRKAGQPSHLVDVVDSDQ